MTRAVVISRSLITSSKTLFPNEVTSAAPGVKTWPSLSGVTLQPGTRARVGGQDRDVDTELHSPAKSHCGHQGQSYCHSESHRGLWRPGVPGG